MLNHKFDLNGNRQRKGFTSCLGLAVLGVAMSFIIHPARAADGYFALGGDATVVDNSLGHPKATQLTSTCAGNCLQGGSAGTLTTASIIYWVTNNLRFDQIHTLRADYRRVIGNCGGGSPRWEFSLDSGDGTPDKRIYAYLGEIYDFKSCAGSWETTGNFIGFGGDSRWDLTKVGGPFYGDYGTAVSRVGHWRVRYIILVMDGSWYPYLTYPVTDPNQQVFHFDNVQIRNDTYSPNGATSVVANADPELVAKYGLEQYVTGVSGPVDLFSQDSFYGRRYSFNNLFRAILNFGRGRDVSNRDVLPDGLRR